MLELRPITQALAFDFIKVHHRHHGVPVGGLWWQSVQDDDGRLVGVAISGRPVARGLDDGLTVEVTRLCTDGAPNACSMLYAAARRAAEAKGFRRGLTYILASEDWRRKLQNAAEVLRRNQPTYRHALRFGLVQETGATIVFHFERLAHKDPSHDH